MSTTTVTRIRTGYRQQNPAGELPILIGILAILIALFGLFFLVVGALLLASGLGLLSLPAAAMFSPIGGSVMIAGAITLIFGAVIVAVATGLWDLETWALWLTGAVIAGVIAVLALSDAFGVTIVIAALLLVYLIAVRKHFY